MKITSYEDTVPWWPWSKIITGQIVRHRHDDSNGKVLDRDVYLKLDNGDAVQVSTGHTASCATMQSTSRTYKVLDAELVVK